MKCPKCQFDNPNGMKFCGECGTKLEKICPKCNFSNPPEFKFCGECGHDLRKPQEIPPEDEPVAKPSPEKILAKEIPPISSPMDGERKYVTALFSDMSGYTAMSEKLDPEEVKDITGRIFGEVSKIVNKYDGFIEKFIGDAVMALFGVPRAHEDDPVRAIRAATEIHHLVRTISPEFEEKIGKPLSMHTGINTGLVVTGEVNTEKGTHGVAGDTINVAARLSSLAEAHTVIVGLDTYRQAEGFFAFETLEPTRVKGKAEPIQIYRLLSAKGRPGTTLRRHGLRADLIGRQVELAQLQEAVEKLKNGKSSIFFICGDTGTGKTRLVEEFRATLDVGTFQWLEGQAYAYSQNTPYFPLIDLLNHVFEIKEGDPPEKVKEKVSRIKEDIKIKKDRKARLEENKKDIQQYEENKKEIEAKIEGLKKGEEYKELNELKAKKNYAKKHIALQKDKLIQLFSSLERPLRKYQRINETEERFIEYYLENSIKALLEDKQFKILTVLHDMKKSIINNTLELKDKKRDKALETINRLDLEYLEGFVDKLKELKNRREEIDNMLRVNKVISNISEYEYRLEHVQDKINRTQHDITLLESSLKTDDMPKIKQRLSENILKVINVEVNIL